MSSLEVILRECVESPEDDAPRHVLANWLDDHGNAERAEFVRGQLMLARMDEDDSARPTLEQRLEAMRLRGQWADSLPEQVTTVHFRRGLMDVQPTEEQFSSLEADAEGWDWVQEVSIIGVVPSLSLARVGASPLAPRLVNLRLGDSGMNASSTRALARSPGLSGLRSLFLSRNSIGNKGAAALAEATFASGLRSLDASYNRIGPAGAIALASSPHLSQLVSLNLDHNSAGAPGLAALLTSRHLPRLESLSLMCNRATTREALDGRAPSLTRLNLSGNSLSQRGTVALAASGLLSKLVRLDLSGNGIGAEGMRALASSPYLAGLVSLNLSYNPLGDEGVRALIRSPHLANLTELQIILWSGNNFSAAVARDLFAWEGMAKLTRLVLNLDDEGAVALASSPHVAGLRDLCLFNSELGDKGAAALANSTHLSGLLRLNLRTNGIGRAGAVAIAGSDSLAGLRCLLMVEDKVGKVGAAALRKRFGNRAKLEP